MVPVRCFIVEDSPVIRENLIATLEEMVALKVVGMAEDEEGAVRWLRSAGGECDLVIIDIFLKTGSGLGVLREARGAFAQRRLVVLSNYATPDMRRRCHELGADRVFDKSSELDELIGYCDELSRQLPS
jgi:DNA-binding NarL/FixJ family response regulator